MGRNLEIQTSRRLRALGQGLVETAIALPVFLLILFGILEFSRAFYQWQSLYRAAAMGARSASMAPSPAAAATIANATTLKNLQSYSFSYDQPQICVPTVNACPGSLGSDPIRVSVSSNFQTVVSNLIPGLANLTLTANGSAFYTGVPKAANLSGSPTPPTSPPPPAPPPAPPAPSVPEG